MTLRILKLTCILCSVVLVWITIQVRQISTIQTSADIAEEPEDQINSDQIFVTFKACNGFANQRISIVYGILIAINLRKSLVLPRLPLDGTQKTGKINIDSNYGASDKFSLVYDLNQLQNYLSGFNLEIWEIDDFPGAKFADADCPGLDMFSCVEHMKILMMKEEGQFFGGIDFGCGFPSELIKKELVFQQAGFVKGILENLLPVGKYLEMVKQMQSSIRKQGKDNKYNLVHLRIEQDWIDHCKRWSSIPDGIVRDNCMNNTETLGHQLQLKNVKNSIPLYIATQTSQAPPQILQTVQKNLQHHGYDKLITKEDIVTTLKTFQIPREIAALIDYFLALQADKFIGNSVSSFSAMALLERQFGGKWGAYYNGGNVPMAAFLPLYKLPWIIYARCDSPDFSNQFTSVALQSIYFYGSVEPHLYCVGKIHNSTLDLVKSVKVNLIQKNRVVRYVKKPDEFVHISYLNGLLMLEEFSKHNFVVFSGPKIFARKRITLDDFFLPLPKTLAMYNQLDKKFTGTMISNVEFVRSGFVNSGMEFFERLAVSKDFEVRTDPRLINSIQKINQFPDMLLMTLNQMSLVDVEKYLENGKCPQILTIPCDQFLEKNCQYFLDMLVLSYVPNKYPLLLKYCNLKLKN